MNEFVKKFEAVQQPWSKQEFEAQIRSVGPAQYHDLHPFHKALHGGKLNKGQVAAWALNRYCYQEAIPRKDAAFMSRAHDRELRREWIHRIHDLRCNADWYGIYREAQDRKVPADRRYLRRRYL